MNNQNFRLFQLHIGDEFVVTEEQLYEVFDVQARMASTSFMRFKLVSIYKKVIWYKPNTWFKKYYQIRVISNGGW